MRRSGLVVVGIFAALATACTVGRDLTYIDPARQAELDQTPAPGGDGGGASSDATGSSGSSGSPTVDPPPAPTGGHDAGRTVTCAAGATNEAEPDDQASQASPAGSGDNCGSVVVGSDVDYWMFTVATDGPVTIALDAEQDAYLGFVDIDVENGGNGSLANGAKTTIPGGIKGHRFYISLLSPRAIPQAYVLTTSY